MNTPLVTERAVLVPEFLKGGGELGELIREYDWSSTSLGPVDIWPQSFRTVISICLNSNFPIAIYWGKNLTLIYNDAWSSIPGNKHPWALGKTAKDVWPDIWEAIEPQFEKTVNGEPGGSKDALLPMHRHGYTEECYFDFTFTPVYGEGGKVEGVFNAVIETTYRVINERRTAFLKDLAINIADAHSRKELFTETIDFLRSVPQDISFALFFSVTDHTTELVASSLTGEETEILRSNLPLAELLQAGKSTYLPDLGRYVATTPKNFWPEEVTQAYAISITGANNSMVGLLICGLSARRHFDEEYKVFLESIGSAVSTVLQNIYSLEEERKKAIALSEIDKAKTTFFSNISHEFRTPLTLLLGPVEDVLNHPGTIPENKARMEVAYRNALRMQRLVNTLLEFSRIEAGRMEGKFAKTDICTVTQDLASTFRSAVEKAGMKLNFECHAIHGDVYVDVEMWEKIVLNLVSNAFKYSKQGAIDVKIKGVGDQVQLSVSDTGVGIPADDLHKIFDRFYRIENIQGRSQEGTGIGLAMVKELVKMHQGTISVVSEVGKGSTFIVFIPIGKEHLPADKIITSATTTDGSNYAEAFVLEAMKWLPGEGINKEVINDVSVDDAEKLVVTEDKPKVLLADDNADMREYVQRLLSNHFEVITAIDGEDAFQKMLQHKPELLLSDIMMPKLDGFGLLKKVRDHLEIKNTPVIFLSARAGEEAKVEGLDAGADDYLVKPFSAKELMVRVSNHIRMNQVRRETEQQFYQLFMQAPAIINVFKGKDHRYELYHPLNKKLFGNRDLTGMKLAEAIPELKGQGIFELLDIVYQRGETIQQSERLVQLTNEKGEKEDHYYNFVYQPWYDLKGNIQGVLNFNIEVTDTVKAHKEIEQSEKELNQLANAVPQLVWVAKSTGEVIYYNDRVKEFDGARKEKDQWQWEGLVHPDDLAQTSKAWNDAVNSGNVYHAEHRIKMKNGEYRWFLSRAIPYKDESGKIIKWFGTATDIHASKMQAAILEKEVEKRTKELNESNLSLKQSNDELQQFAHVASHDLKEPVRKVKTFTHRLLQDKASSFSENEKLYLSKVDAAADRMNIMIEGVLNYSMLSGSHQKIEAVDLNDIITTIESDLELLITQKNAVIKHGHLPTVQGASVLLYQLFYNLLNNSLKFAKANIASEININAGSIIKEKREFAVITLEDNGIGFEQQFAGKIFETFLRLNSKDRFEGTGLGLSLCKRIVERHNGNISAFGEPGLGSKFIIELPLEQEKGSI